MTLTEVRYWYYHQTPDKQKEINNCFENFSESELLGNAFFEQVRDVYYVEIKAWYE